MEEIDDSVVIEKAKKPRTKAQVEAWEKALQKRKENVESKIKDKYEKVLEEKMKKLDVKKDTIKKKLPLPQPIEDSESEEEIIIKKIKSKRPVKKIIYVESESEEEEAPVIEKVKRKIPRPQPVPSVPSPTKASVIFV